MTNWNEIAKQHHANMVEKGFHDNYSHTDLLLRGIEEVGEATKAWRKNRRADMAGFNASKNVSNIYEISLNYEVGIKGAIEEELADIALIMLHFSAANNININPAGFVQKDTPIKVLMRISKFICFIDSLCESIEDRDESPLVGSKTITNYVNSIFSNLEMVAKDLDINLEEQVELKMQYNKTRPYKHGDKN